MRHKWVKAIVVMACYLSPPLPSIADNVWRTRAVVTVENTGVMEAIIPPELIRQTDPLHLDFSLVDTKGRSRAFEIYWREAVGESRLELRPTQVQLDSVKGMIWEADLPEKFLMRRLHIRLNDQSTIGKIDVYGRQDKTWSLLVKNAAVFETAGIRQATIDIPANTYNGLQLHITGYDRRIRQTLVPIRSVVIEGDRQGKDYAEQTIQLPFHQFESEGGQIIEAVLPGDGLWIESLHMTSQFHFQGDWQIGRNQIQAGTQHFTSITGGRQDHITQTQPDFEAVTHQHWPGRSIVCRLNSGSNDIGQVTRLTITVRLPRVIFAAEQIGRYTAMTGIGHYVQALDQKDADLKNPHTQLTFSVPEKNPAWRLASLVEKYQLMGGPFDSNGYTWRSSIRIPAPGYYRLPLNLEASLAPQRTAVRIVRDNNQVPYITGRPEDRSIDLEFASAYDAQKNTSTWTVKLPLASTHWKSMILHASGIFKRTVELQKTKPGTHKWQSWRRQTWENRAGRASSLKLDLRQLTNDERTLRLVIGHGDNQPIAISHITAVYSSPTIYFLAHTQGDYTIYGGNPKTRAPQYDLSLVRSELLSTLPSETRMSPLETFRQPGWKSRINMAFTEKGWGLYAVLGIVTLILLIVIIKLFPKPLDKEPS